MALKRIPDVLSSPEQAKRVLREVCILRRLRYDTRPLRVFLLHSVYFLSGPAYAYPDHCTCRVRVIRRPFSERTSISGGRRHPFLINLRDAFTRPSSSGSLSMQVPAHALTPCRSGRLKCALQAGPRKMVGGKLVAMSIDVYISMEFGAEGDLFNLRHAHFHHSSPGTEFATAC